METYVFDTILIDINAGISLTGYDLRIKFKRPNGHIGWWLATIDPTDAKHMYYETDTNDLNMPGTWSIQAYAYQAGVARLHGKWCTFEVLTPYADTSTPPTTLAPTTI